MQLSVSIDCPFLIATFSSIGVMLLQKIYRSLRSVLLIFLVFCVLLLCVFTFWVPCCDFRIQTMVRSSLSPVVCKRAHVLLTLFVFACGQWCPTDIVFVFCLFLFGFYSLSCATCVANVYGVIFFKTSRTILHRNTCANITFAVFMAYTISMHIITT